MRKTAYLLRTVLVLFLMSSGLGLACAGSTDYLYLDGVGDSMAPTMVHGDTVTVRVGCNGSTIRSGLHNSSHPGDIIVYGSIAAISYVPQPTHMWIGHRVVDKSLKNGVWHFRTKGDNNPEMDPWEVPDYWVLGVVVELDQRDDSTMERAPTFGDSSYTDEGEANPSISAIGDLAVGLVVGILMGLLFIKLFRFESIALTLSHERTTCRRRREDLRNNGEKQNCARGGFYIYPWFRY